MSWIAVIIALLILFIISTIWKGRPLNFKAIKFLYTLKGRQRWFFLKNRGFNTITSSPKNGYSMQRYSMIWARDKVEFPSSAEEVEQYNTQERMAWQMKYSSQLDLIEVEPDFVSYGLLKSNRLSSLEKQILKDGFSLITPDIEVEKKNGINITKEIFENKEYYYLDMRLRRRIELYQKGEFKVLIQWNADRLAFFSLYKNIY